MKKLKKKRITCDNSSLKNKNKIESYRQKKRGMCLLQQNHWSVIAERMFHSIFLFHFHKSCARFAGVNRDSFFLKCDIKKLQFMALQLNFMRLSFSLPLSIYFALKWKRGSPFFACYIIKSLDTGVWTM